MYVGRFAPSPSGPLHLGSLAAALASYIDAKAHNGSWLLRIEDLDTPRCNPAFSQLIIDTLCAHGLESDRPVVFQSERLAFYQKALNAILSAKKAYYCECSRKQIKEQGGIYLNTCRTKHLRSGAVRFIHTQPITKLNDRFKGTVLIDDGHALEDFILLRKDNIYAYKLAVVVDDIEQGITHIVRGDDLLSTTSAHLSLYRHFKCSAPVYAHIPVLKDATGNKLSKQNHAPAISSFSATENLLKACEALGVRIPTYVKAKQQDVPPKLLLEHAIQAWRIKHMLVDNQNIK